MIYYQADLSLNIWKSQIFYLHLHNKFSTTMLTKKDRKKRYNKKFPKSGAHTFEGFFSKMTTQTQEAFKGDNLGGAIGGIAGAATGAINTGMEAAKLQGVEEAQADIDKQAAFQSTATTQDDLLAEMAGAGNIKSDYNHKDFMQSGGDFAKSMVSGAIQGAASGASAGPWGAVAGAAASLISGAIGRGAASAKAKVEAAEKNQAAKEANQAKAQALTAKAGALDQAADARSLAAYYAEGGELRQSKIPSFPEFPSSLVKFNTGGTHEENPYDGIPQGIAPDGLPNLVEEGEVKYDDYIFSDRLMLDKKDKKKYKFLKGDTYAQAAENIAKESSERPNDLISKNTREANLKVLQFLQEKERQKRGLQGENRMMYKNGGHIFWGGKDQWYTFTSGAEGKAGGYTLATSQKRKDVMGALGKGEALAYGHMGEDGNFVTTKDYTKTGALTDKKLQRQAYRDAVTTNSTTPNYLSMAPVIGNVVGAAFQAFNTPDYEHAKELQQAEAPITPITYTPVTQRMTYKPMDVNYYGSKLGAQAGATRQAVREQTASNPYASTAALIAADANAQSQLGDLYKKAEEYNLAQKEKVATFNRGTDATNAEMAMKAAQLNASLADSRAKRQLERDNAASKLKVLDDQAWSEAMSSSMTGIFDNIGKMGKQRDSQDLAMLEYLGHGMPVTPEIAAWFKKRGWSQDSIDIILEASQRNRNSKKGTSTNPKSVTSGTESKYGGYLKRKKGYTI